MLNLILDLKVRVPSESAAAAAFCGFFLVPNQASGENYAIFCARKDARLLQLFEQISDVVTFNSCQSSDQFCVGFLSVDEQVSTWRGFGHDCEQLDPESARGD